MTNKYFYQDCWYIFTVVLYSNIIPKSSEQQWFLAGLTSYILEGGRRGGKKVAK